MRICLIYDCLFPHSVGGAERWYRNLATALAADGHEVTYLTLKQWEGRDGADFGEGRAVPVAPGMRLYDARGRRRLLPPLLFGLGVLVHLLRAGRRYDVVHTASFPYFSLLAAQAARPLGRYSLHVDWHEVWTRDYWREYVGPRRGTLGWLVQRACLRLPQDRAYCFSQLQARRLRAEGVSSDPVVLRGQYAGPLERPAPRPAEDTVLFVGRLVADKQAHRLVEAVALARRRAPCLRAEIVGAGPEAGTVARAIAEHGLENVVTATGFEPDERVRERLGRALCLVLPSRREGFGLVVVEAAAAGIPSVVAAGPDNAAVELIENGENGWVAASDAPADLAEAILCVREAGPALRERTADWFVRHAAALAMSHSVEVVTAAHREGRGSRAGG